MDQILTNHSSPTTIKKLHVCRLYLQVTLLSDITNLKGDKHLTNSLQGIREKHRTSTYAWPRQQHPNAHSWKLCEKILQTIYCSPTSNFLCTSLWFRRWKNCSIVHHRYLYFTLEQEIYYRDHPNITQWFASTPTRKYISLIPAKNSTCARIPSDTYPINPIYHTIFQIESSIVIITPSGTFFKDLVE